MNASEKAIRRKVLLRVPILSVITTACLFGCAGTPACRFFSSHVRIQTDRGHVVVSDGPYACVRHPGYAGSIVYNLAAPIALGSLPACWVGVAMLVLVVLRTAPEDGMLQEHPQGFCEYAETVRRRLVPPVW